MVGEQSPITKVQLHFFMEEIMDAKLKISRANTRLYIKHPFFGSLSMSLQFKQAPDGTMATDGRAVFWCEDFVTSITEDELTGVIAHEVMHVALKHHLRRGERDANVWNEACDYAINLLVLDAGLSLPEGGLVDEAYKGMTAERIYDLLIQDPSKQQGAPEWGEVVDMTNEDGTAMGEAERQQAEAETDIRVFMAAESAKAVGKLSNAIAGLIDEMRKSKVDWRDKLRRFIGGDQPDDYSFRKPNRKAWHQYRTIMPSVERSGAGNLVVAVDTSASVSNSELQQFLGEINAISDDTCPTSVTVIQCDTGIRDVRRYEQGEVIDSFEVQGRGGTRVTPVFDYVDDNGIQVDTLVYLTDLEVHDFPEQPDYPVLWVSTSADVAPWGEVAMVKVA